MGDNILDSPGRTSPLPEKPLETYRWEDVRRQKLAGCYPWTHIYKPPFDINEWEKQEACEYEPVGPMDNRRTTSPPEVKVTDADGLKVIVADQPFPSRTSAERQTADQADTDNEMEDSDEEMEENLTASDFQSRLEKRFFSAGESYQTTEHSDTGVEITEIEEEKDVPSFHDKMHQKAERLKEKFKNFREQRAKKEEDGQEKQEHRRFKDRFRKFKKPNLHLPDTLTRSFPTLSFSRSRSNSVKENEAPEKEETKRKFDFGTYPRVFRKKKKPVSENDYYEPVGPSRDTSSSRADSVPGTSSEKKPPLSQKLFSKFSFKHVDEKSPRAKSEEPAQPETEVKSSLLVSFKPKENTSSAAEEDKEPKKIVIDNKNFFFISLHEDRHDLKPSPFGNLSAAYEVEEEPKEPRIAGPSGVKSPFKLGGKASLWDVALKNKAELERQKQQEEQHETRISESETTDIKNHQLLPCETQRTEEKANKPKLLEKSPSRTPDRDQSDLKSTREGTPRDTRPIVKSEKDRQCDIRSIVKSEKEPPRYESEEDIHKESFATKLNVSLKKLLAPLQTRDQKEHRQDSEEEESLQQKTRNQKGPEILSFITKTSDEKPKVVRKLSITKTTTKTVYPIFDHSKVKEPSPNSFEGSSVTNTASQSRYQAYEMQKGNEMTQKGILKHTDPRQLRSLDMSTESLVSSAEELNRYEEYESALEKSKLSSDYYSALEVGKRTYSSENSLAKLGGPSDFQKPPVRPTRTRSLRKNKRKGDSRLNDGSCGNENYNTFPLSNPQKPQRKFKKRRRKHSTSTLDSDQLGIINIDDKCVSRNLAQAKQLSISYLPLGSNVVDDEDISSNYNLRETSSMIHIDIREPTPIPRKKKRNCKESSSVYRPISSSMLNYDEQGNQIEYADELSNSNSVEQINVEIPARPQRKKSGISTREQSEERKQSEMEDSRNHSIAEQTICDELRKVKRTSSSASERSTLKDRVRRLSEFFTLPRVPHRENYVLPASATLDRRGTSPSRPPRKTRNKEHIYTNDELLNSSDSGDEEELRDRFDNEESASLQSGEVLEKMKTRPLPAPPRPGRKSREREERTETIDGYSQCKKSVREKEVRIAESLSDTSSKKLSLSEHSISTQTSPAENKQERFSERDLKVVRAQTLEVSELNVGKLNISEIDSSRIITSNIDSVTLHVSEMRSECSNLVLGNIELPPRVKVSPDVQQQNFEVSSEKSSLHNAETARNTPERSRISSLIPEIGSEEEEEEATPAVPPARKKHRKSNPSLPERDSARDISPVQGPSNHDPTLSELSYQILQICQSSIGQAIHATIEQLFPDSRDKRNDIQAAIWIITIIVAGCLVLGLGPTENTVHHHHWDFHFPPPQ